MANLISAFSEDSLYKIIKSENIEKVENYLTAIYASSTPLTTNEEWQVRAYKGTYPISKEEYTSLSPKLQKQLYKIGNIYRNISWVTLLKSYGAALDDSLLCSPIAPSFLSDSMDIVEFQNAISSYIKKLIDENRLFTCEAFEMWKRDKTLISKGRKFERIIGRDYLQSKITECGLTSIRVPNKVAVFNSERMRVTTRFVLHSFHGCESRTLWPILLEGDMDQEVNIYAEKIEPCNRYVSREEMRQLLTLCEKSNYNDLWINNFIIAKDAIYLIDTEYNSFSCERTKEKLDRLLKFLAPEDHAWYQELVDEEVLKLESTRNKFFEDYDKNHKTWEALLKKRRAVTGFLSYKGMRRTYEFPLKNSSEKA